MPRVNLAKPEAKYAGAAGDSGLTVEFNRDYDADPGKFGICKTAVSGGYQAEENGYNQYPRDVVPQHADRYYLGIGSNTIRVKEAWSCHVFSCLSHSAHQKPKPPKPIEKKPMAMRSMHCPSDNCCCGFSSLAILNPQAFMPSVCLFRRQKVV